MHIQKEKPTKINWLVSQHLHKKTYLFLFLHFYFGTPRTDERPFVFFIHEHLTSQTDERPFVSAIVSLFRARWNFRHFG